MPLGKTCGRPGKLTFQEQQRASRQQGLLDELLVGGTEGAPLDAEIRHLLTHQAVLVGIVHLVQ